MNKFMLSMIVFVFSNGCASFGNGTTQRVDMRTQNEIGHNTTCSFINDEGRLDNIKIPSVVVVNRDGNPLIINCKNDQQTGTVKQDPEFQTKYIIANFFLIDACTISCLIDASTNAFYSYPPKITVNMTPNL